MTRFKSAAMIATLTLTVSSSAFAGTIIGARTSRTGTIIGARTGTIIGASTSDTVDRRISTATPVDRKTNSAVNSLISENMIAIMRLFLESSLF